MIKRLTFASRRTDLTRASFASVWPDAVAGCAEAPAEVRPARVTVSTSLAQLIPGEPAHDAIVAAWFADGDHLDRFDTWLQTAHGRSVRGRMQQLLDDDTSHELVVEEVVQRGADWLDQRWSDGSEQLKHLAIAGRAEGLSVAEFAERWKAHAGQAQGAGDRWPTVIPDDVRGIAYIQNLPLPLTVGEPPYDAVNEVYLDGIESLRARIAWFDANEVGGGDELFGPSVFLAVREAVVLPVPASV